jgi:hypothetical protein
MRIAIIGCRPPAGKDATAANVALFQTILRDVDELVDSLPPETVVVSGGAMGVDSRAVRRAVDRFMRFKEHLPDYAKHGPRRAPLIRNETIVDDCEQLYAFVAPWSRGTRHAIGLARRKKRSHVVREYGGGWKPDVREQVLGEFIEVAGRRSVWRDED